MITPELLTLTFSGQEVKDRLPESMQIKEIEEGRQRAARRHAVRPVVPDLELSASGLVLSVVRMASDMRRGHRLLLSVPGQTIACNVPDSLWHIVEGSPPIVPTDRVRIYGRLWFHKGRPVLEADRLVRTSG